MFRAFFKLSLPLFPNINSCLLLKSPASRAGDTAHSDPGLAQLWGSEMVMGEGSRSPSPSVKRSGIPCISTCQSPPRPFARWWVLLARNRTRPSAIVPSCKTPSLTLSPPHSLGKGPLCKHNTAVLPFWETCREGSKVGMRLLGTGNGDMKLGATQRHWVEFGLAAAQAGGWHGGGMRRERQTGGRLRTALPTLSGLDDIPGAMGSYWRILSNKRHNQIWVF